MSLLALVMIRPSGHAGTPPVDASASGVPLAVIAPRHGPLVFALLPPEGGTLAPTRYALDGIAIRQSLVEVCFSSPATTRPRCITLVHPTQAPTAAPRTRHFAVLARPSNDAALAQAVAAWMAPRERDSPWTSATAPTPPTTRPRRPPRVAAWWVIPLLLAAVAVIAWLARQRLRESWGHRSPMRRVASIGAAILLGTLAAIGLTEASIRMTKPLPPIQIVRDRGLRLVDGVPVWEESADRQNRECAVAHPERVRVAFFGSSITYGSLLSSREALTTLLQERLDGVGPTPGVCVMNFAQPGYGFDQKYAVARTEVARYRPALVLWESWQEWHDYALLGDSAYMLTGFARRADGYPGLAGVPGRVNRVLFRRLRLYEYLTLGFGARVARPDVAREAAQFARERLVRVPELAASVGAKLALYPTPPLDRPFAAYVATPPEWRPPIVELARQRSIPLYPLERELADQDYLELRADPCCHFNARGHRELARVFERIVRELLGDRGGGPAQGP